MRVYTTRKCLGSLDGFVLTTMSAGEAHDLPGFVGAVMLRAKEAVIWKPELTNAGGI